MNRSPLISVIVAVRNGESTIAKCITSLSALRYPNREIIIVNDGSTDRTGQILENFKENVRIIATPGLGASAARNLGIRTARGAYLAFTDDDCIVDPGWLSALFDGFQRDGLIGSVGGDQQSPPDDTPFGKTVNCFMKSVGFMIDYVKDVRQSFIATSHNPSCNVMYDRRVFDTVGFFCEDLWPGEDVEFDYRVRKSGFALLYNPSAVVQHYRPATLDRFARMMFNYGKVQALLLRKYGFFRALHYEPFALLFLMLLAVLLIPGARGWGILLISVTVLAVVASVAKAPDKRLSLRFFSLGLVALFFWNAGFAAGMIGKGIRI